MDNKFNYGEQLKKLRLERGLSQEDIGFDSELTPQYYGTIERGQTNPTVSTLEKICDAMGLSLVYIFAESNTNIFNIDPLSMQILHLLHGKTEKEKELALSLLKTAFKLQNENKK